MAKGMPQEIGLRVDVLDDEGIWNTGVIVDVSEEGDDMVEIKYDGWGDEFNQWIAVADDRLAPLHTYTLVKKCWAKLSKYPWWPAFVVLRAPTNQSAANGLQEEKKLYVEFYDSFDESKRSRCWMQKKMVESFQEGFEERAAKRVGNKFHEYVEATQRAAAGDSPLLFSGAGTLPIEYSSRMADPLAVQRKKYDADKWFDAYRLFSDRYHVLYGYTGNSDSSAAPKRKSEDEEAEIPEIDDVRPSTNVKKKSAKTPPKKAAKKSPKKPAVKKSASKARDNDESEEEPEEEEDEDESGRRSSRLQQKRERDVVPPTRRTRARRVKVIEELFESFAASSFSTPGLTMFKAGSDFGPASFGIQLGPDLTSSQIQDAFKTETNGEWIKSEIQPSIKATAGGSSSEGRRKQSFPQRLSEKKAALAVKVEARERGSLAAWAGGSRYEVDHEPWTIQGWFMSGLRTSSQQ